MQEAGQYGYHLKSNNTNNQEEKKLIAEKRKQPGVSFPSSVKQEYALIVRLDLIPSVVKNTKTIQQGLRRLCDYFERIDVGKTKIEIRRDGGAIERAGLLEFNFSATIGFGSGFFSKQHINRNVPSKLCEMPFHIDIGDQAQYVFTQTDMIIQLCSTRDFVNRWVLENDTFPMTFADEDKGHLVRQRQDSARKPHDIATCIKGWAFITDVHSGFQRLDGRNLMGFGDGISQPDRLRNNVIWTTKDDEGTILTDGTYMVFQKIEHDLELWAQLSVMEQERWVGRSKGTGLLLGTLSREEDARLAEECRSDDPRVSKAARYRLNKLLAEQEDPHSPLYTSKDPRHSRIRVECPVWSHVRKANPRGADGEAFRIIYRRGYLFMEDTIHPGKKHSSGLLFICFQRDIKNGFEYIKKNFLNNKEYPVPHLRKEFNKEELAFRHAHGRFSEAELSLFSPKSSMHSRDQIEYKKRVLEAQNPDLHNTGKEGLAGPSQLGVYPRGDVVATVTLGGGYYFIPPIPNKRISEIGQQFFG
jgi:Dyp-type peroxidase family